jgi:CheY-like chemotaxis protein
VRRALVAVPDPAVALAISRHLGRRGFEIAEAQSVDALLGIVEHVHADGGFGLILVDAALPGSVENDPLPRLLEIDPNTSVVLVVPGAAEPLARASLKRGAVAYLLRPFGLFELDAIVGRALARIELAEVKRQRALRPGLPPIIDYELLPARWLDWGDERSSAGSGHGYRVARAAKAIAAALPELDGEERWPLEFAARAHELGRLGGTVCDDVELGSRTAAMLVEIGVDGRVADLVRQMHERWDGRGRPSGAAGTAIPPEALVLAAADRIDHTAAARTGGRHGADSGIAEAHRHGAGRTPRRPSARTSAPRLGARGRPLNRCGRSPAGSPNTEPAGALQPEPRPEHDESVVLAQRSVAAADVIRNLQHESHAAEHQVRADADLKRNLALVAGSGLPVPDLIEGKGLALEADAADHIRLREQPREGTERNTDSRGQDRTVAEIGSPLNTLLAQRCAGCVARLRRKGAYSRFAPSATVASR